MLPYATFTIERPAPLADGPTAKRMHNKAGKEALRLELEKHHQKRLPGHFQQTNRAKYGHKPRSPGYLRYKLHRFRSMTDLVKTGRTSREFKRNVKIRIGGTASGETGLTGRLIYRFPFPESRNVGWKDGKRRHGVTAEQMHKEIATITPDERREIAEGYARNYARLINEALKNSPRLRKRLGLT